MMRSSGPWGMAVDGRDGTLRRRDRSVLRTRTGREVLRIPPPSFTQCSPGRSWRGHLVPRPDRVLGGVDVQSDLRLRHRGQHPGDLSRPRRGRQRDERRRQPHGPPADGRPRHHRGRSEHRHRRARHHRTRRDRRARRRTGDPCRARAARRQRAHRPGVRSLGHALRLLLAAHDLPERSEERRGRGDLRDDRTLRPRRAGDHDHDHDHGTGTGGRCDGAAGTQE